LRVAAAAAALLLLFLPRLSLSLPLLSLHAA
jgi:hypothetical protein